MEQITEEWQLGKVKTNKISKGFPYLVASNLTVPLQTKEPTIQPNPAMPQFQFQYYLSKPAASGFNNLNIRK